jgi:hypothetical protein
MGSFRFCILGFGVFMFQGLKCGEGLGGGFVFSGLFFEVFGPTGTGFVAHG